MPDSQINQQKIEKLEIEIDKIYEKFDEQIENFNTLDSNLKIAIKQSFVEAFKVSPTYLFHEEFLPLFLNTEKMTENEIYGAENELILQFSQFLENNTSFEDFKKEMSNFIILKNSTQSFIILDNLEGIDWTDAYQKFQSTKDKFKNCDLSHIKDLFLKAEAKLETSSHFLEPTMMNLILESENEQKIAEPPHYQKYEKNLQLKTNQAEKNQAELLAAVQKDCIENIIVSFKKSLQDYQKRWNDYPNYVNIIEEPINQEEFSQNIIKLEAEANNIKLLLEKNDATSKAKIEQFTSLVKNLYEYAADTDDDLWNDTVYNDYIATSFDILKRTQDENIPINNFQQEVFELTYKKYQNSQNALAWKNQLEFIKHSLIANIEVAVQSEKTENDIKDIVQAEISKATNSINFLQKINPTIDKNEIAQLQTIMTRLNVTEVWNNPDVLTVIKNSNKLSRSLLFNIIDDYSKNKITDVTAELDAILNDEELLKSYQGSAKFTSDENLERDLYWNINQPQNQRSKKSLIEKNIEKLNALATHFAVVNNDSVGNEKYQNLSDILTTANETIKENQEQLLYDKTSLFQNLLLVKKTQEKNYWNKHTEYQKLKPIPYIKGDSRDVMFNKLHQMHQPDAGYSKAIKARAKELENYFNALPADKSNDEKIKKEILVSKFVNLPQTETKVDFDNLENVRNSLLKESPWLEKPLEAVITTIKGSKNIQDNKFQVICLDGPAGIGKTDFAKKLANGLKLKFAKVSLSGAKTPEMINGFNFTFASSNEGAISAALIRAGSTNPVILIDEVDKSSEEVMNTLLDLFASQEKDAFKDNYFDVGIDFSKVIFIATSNNFENISGPLRDRMEIISCEPPTLEQKITVFEKRLQSLKETTNFKNFEIDSKIAVKIVNEIIDNNPSEEGIRRILSSADHLFLNISEVARQNPKQKLLINEQNLSNYWVTDNSQANFALKPATESSTQVVSQKLRKHQAITGFDEWFPSQQRRLMANVGDLNELWRKELTNESLKNKPSIKKELAQKNQFLKVNRNEIAANKNLNKQFLTKVKNIYLDYYFNKNQVAKDDFQTTTKQQQNLRIEFSDGKYSDYPVSKLNVGHNEVIVPNPNYVELDQYNLKYYPVKLKATVDQLRNKIKTIAYLPNIPVKVQADKNDSAENKKETKLNNLAIDIFLSDKQFFEKVKTTKNISSSDSETKTVNSGGSSTTHTSIYNYQTKNQSYNHQSPSTSSQDSKVTNQGLNFQNVPDDQEWNKLILDYFEQEKTNKFNQHRSFFSGFKMAKSHEQKTFKIDYNLSTEAYLDLIIDEWNYQKTLMQKHNYPYVCLIQETENTIFVRLEKLCQSPDLQVADKIKIQELAGDMFVTFDNQAHNHSNLTNMLDWQLSKEASKNESNEKCLKYPIAHLAIVFNNMQDNLFHLMETTDVALYDENQFKNQFTKIKILHPPNLTLTSGQKKLNETKIAKLNETIATVEEKINRIKTLNRELDTSEPKQAEKPKLSPKIVKILENLEIDFDSCQKLKSEIFDASGVRVILPPIVSKNQAHFSFYKNDKTWAEISTASKGGCFPLWGQSNDETSKIILFEDKKYENLVSDQIYKDKFKHLHCYIDKETRKRMRGSFSRIEVAEAIEKNPALTDAKLCSWSSLETLETVKSNKGDNFLNKPIFHKQKSRPIRSLNQSRTVGVGRGIQVALDNKPDAHSEYQKPLSENMKKSSTINLYSDSSETSLSQLT